MNKVAVVYKSKYGYTKTYAEWIAEELDVPLFCVSDVSPAQLAEFDTVVYGGGVYAGGISGSGLVNKLKCKNAIVFSVGIADPVIADYSYAVKNLGDTKCFHFRGGIDFTRLGFVTKILIKAIRAEASKKDITTLTSDEEALLTYYGKTVDFTDKNAIAPLVEYVRKI